MATQTQTLRRPHVQSERTHDYLYDPHYTVSSDRDHARATFKAHTGTDRVKRLPVYPNMFSELRHHPKYAVRLESTDPVPNFISRQWRGYQEQAREALIRHKTFNFDPSVQVPHVSHEDAQVTGVNRYKYFRSADTRILSINRPPSAAGVGGNKSASSSRPEGAYTTATPSTGQSRPIIPFLQQVPPDVLLASARQDPLGAGLMGAERAAMLERPPTPPTKTIETQTDYRDSEAQTDPYTPEYVVRPGSQPELLTLATLSYGRGLPAGLAEVEMIERARSKRAWEATLPPLDDVSQLDKRRKMMDDMERKEWALRESEIEKLQDARLDVLKKLLIQREENHQEMNTKRLDRLWAQKQEKKEEKIKQIRNEHIKTIRKLTEKRRKVEGKLERRDVTYDYSDPGSQTYAPLTRIGVFMDRGSEQFVVKSRYLSTYQGLLELEQSLPDFVTAPRIRAPKPRTVTKSGFIRRKYRQERQLQEIHEVIKENRTREEEPPKPLKFLEKIEKPIPRPATPAVVEPDQEEEERELAVIFLQQVIRGRAVQNMMFEGKEKRIELIRELRSTHALQEAEQSVKKQERQATLALQRQRRLHEHKESYVDEGLGQIEGESLGDMLDFLSKELIRLQEERRIHAFSMLAERQRRIREAEESGRRQLEERQRRQQDEIFKQVIKVHQTSVDTYLEDVIMNSVDAAAGEQARAEIQAQADKINDIAYEIEDKRTELESEEIVSELVHSFLLPEVNKVDVRQKIRMQQRKYLSAAHHEIHKTGIDIIEQIPTAPKTETPREVDTPAAYDEPVTSARAQSPEEKAATPQEPARTPQEPAGTPQEPARTPSGSAAPTPRDSRVGTPQSSRPTSANKDGGKSSRKSSTTSLKSQKSSGRGTPEQKPSSSGLDLSVQGKGSAGSQKQTSSKPSTPVTSKPPTPRESKPSMPQGSRQATPIVSRQATPQVSRTPTPQGSKPTTPVTSKPPTPSGSRTATPRQASSPAVGSKVTSPAGSKPPTPAGSRRGSAHSNK